MSDQEINDWLDILYSDFSEGEISFEVVGKEIIKDDYFYYYSFSKFNELISHNSHDNAIDIYFLNSGTNEAKIEAKANGIPSTALVIGKDWSGTSVISHEMGHCLGLYHTHEWRFGKDFDGSHCEEKGDKVCDTPPDPGLKPYYDQLEQNGCDFVWDPTPWICCPQVENIMSYAPPSCMELFTYGQFSRAHTVVNNSTLLQNTYFHISTPQNLSWVNYSGHPKLSWDAVSNPNANSYKIYRNINDCGSNCGSYSLIATVNGNTTTFTDTEVSIKNKNAPLYAYYYVTATNQSYESFPSNIVDVPTNTISKLHSQNSNDNKNIILGVYPNPFNSSTNIKFNINSSENIIIKIYNSLGKEIKNINLGRLNSGVYEFNINFFNYSSGVYHYRIFNEVKVIAKGKLINLK